MGIEYIATSEDELIRGRARMGNAEIIVCTDGTCRMDGGAMFGVVPKTLWSRRMPADAENHVMLGLNCVVVKLNNKTLLIETGFGNKLLEKTKRFYSVEERLPASLTAAGVTPESVDYVINSHLHWDHCGWNTVMRNGEAVPFFPRAQYIAHIGEVEHGRLQLERDRVSYVPDNYEPLIHSGQMHLVQGGSEDILPGVRVECFPGHTAHCIAVHVESGGEHACFISDLIPTTAHLDVTWAMGFDLDPLRTIAERKRFYERALDEHWLVLFPHDHQTPLATLERDEKGRAKVMKL